MAIVRIPTVPMINIAAVRILLPGDYILFFVVRTGFEPVSVSDLIYNLIIRIA